MAVKKPRPVVYVITCASVVFASTVALAQDQNDLVPLVVDLLKDPDKLVRALAYEQIRNEAPGKQATLAFAQLLPELPVDAQVGLLGALADRGDNAAAPAVRDLLESSKQEQVRVAAIKALGRLGETPDLKSLTKYLSDGSPDEQAAAERSLVVLPGEEVSAAIAGRIGVVPAPVAVSLIEILTTRRARNTMPALLSAAGGDAPIVRRAAMEALGKLADPQHIPGMVQGILKAERGRERDAAEKAVMLVCHRIEDPHDRAAPLLDAMDSLPKSQQTILLPTLGRVGGPQARKVVEAAIRNPDPEVHDTAMTAICNWPDAAIAFRLLELARTEEHPGHRRRALRALIRVAPLPDGRPDQLRLDLMRTAMAMCWEDADRLLILERAKAIRSVETLRFVRPYMEQSPYAEQACLTVVELAHHSELRETHRAEFHAALDRVIEISGDATVVQRAERYKKGQTWEPAE